MNLPPAGTYRALLAAMTCSAEESILRLAAATASRGQLPAPRLAPDPVCLRLHHGGPQGAKPEVEVAADILASIKDRKA